MTPAGFPHSDIRGSREACSSPRLIAACHVLHRLSAPRHPPCALTTLGRFRIRAPTDPTARRYSCTTTEAAAPDDFVRPTLHSAYCARLFPQHPHCQTAGTPRGRTRPIWSIDNSGFDGSDGRLPSGIQQVAPPTLVLQKGGDPAAGSPTATLLRLRPSHRACLRPLPPCGWDTDFGHSRLPWRDGRCVQGPGTYSPWRS